MPDYIVWDWNGTLLDDVDAAWKTVNSLLRVRGLPELTLERYRADFGFPVSNFYRKIGVDPDGEDWDALSAEYHRRFHLKRIFLQRQAESVLAEWLSRGVRQAILSASEQSLLSETVAAAGISRCFEHVLGSDNLYGSSKLALAGILENLAGLKREDKVLMVGDTLHDAEIAQAMGWRCVLLSGGHQSEERLRSAGVPLLHTLDAILLMEF